MAHTLPSLPYAFDALEPYIDKMTMEIHHDRHHKAYVDTLNKALESAPELQSKSIEDLLRGIKSVPEAIRTAVRMASGTPLIPRSKSSMLLPCKSGALSSALLRLST